MASIYEITNQFPFLAQLEETGEVDPEAIKGALEVAREDLAYKLEDYCKVIKNFESDIAGLKEEEARLKAKRQTLQNTIDRMKDAMKYALEVAKETKIPCGTFTVTIQNNPESVVMDEQYLENIPEEYLKYKEPEIDRAKLKEHLKAGINLEGIAHLEQSTGLRIR